MLVRPFHAPDPVHRPRGAEHHANGREQEKADATVIPDERRDNQRPEDGPDAVHDEDAARTLQHREIRAIARRGDTQGVQRKTRRADKQHRHIEDRRARRRELRSGETDERAETKQAGDDITPIHAIRQAAERKLRERPADQRRRHHQPDPRRPARPPTIRR